MSDSGALALMGLWWEAPKYKAHHYLQSWIDTVLMDNNRRFQDYVRFAGIDGNWDTIPRGGSFLATGIPSGVPIRRVTFNMTSSMVDTVVNQRMSEHGRLMAESIDGDYMQFMTAKMLTMALRHEFDDQQVDLKFYNVVRDAIRFGRGLGTVDKDMKNGKLIPVLRRQFSPEVVVDPFENCVDDWPFSFTICRYVGQAKLMRRWPEHADAILKAPQMAPYSRVRGTQNIRLDEAWTPAQGNEPGRHVVCINGVTLVDEAYEHKSPPFAALAWQPPTQGWYARGLIDELLGLQMEVDMLMEIIHEAHLNFAHPFMAVEQNANVDIAHIQNSPARVLKYLQTPPQLLSYQMVSPEVYAHLERCYQKGYEIAGISPYVAQAKSLERLESSLAQRSMQDMNDQRHFYFAKQCERFIEDWAKLFCRVAAECDSENGYNTKLPVSAYFPNIPWSQVAYDIEKYKVKLGTVNPLMGKTSEDLQEIQEAMQMAQMTPTQFRQYMDNPDVHKAAHMATASDDYIMWVMHKLTVDGEYMSPSNFVDKKAAMQACIEHWLIGERLGWPDGSPKAPQYLMDYFLECKQALMADAMEAMSRQQGLMPGQTPAQPGTPQPPVPSQTAGMPQQPTNVNIQNVQNGGVPAA